MNVMEVGRRLQRCGVRGEDCPIHHKPHHGLDPLKWLLLGFLGRVFAGGVPYVLDLSFLSIASAVQEESAFRRRRVESNVTQNGEGCCIRVSHIAGGNEKAPGTKLLTLWRGVYRSLWILLDVKRRRNGLS